MAEAIAYIKTDRSTVDEALRDLFVSHDTEFYRADIIARGIETVAREELNNLLEVGYLSERSIPGALPVTLESMQEALLYLARLTE